MRNKRAKEIRQNIRDAAAGRASSKTMENTYRKAKREYVREPGRQHPKLRTSKRQKRIIETKPNA